MLLQAALELPPHLRAEAVPHKLGQVKGSCFDPFFQADALVQRAGVLTVIFRAVWAFHILGFISETGMVQAVASGPEVGWGHHLLFHLAQRGIPHKVACHG